MSVPHQFKLICSSCKESKDKNSFSNAQIRKADLRRCFDCVEQSQQNAKPESVQPLPKNPAMSGSLNTNQNNGQAKKKNFVRQQPNNNNFVENLVRPNSCNKCKKPGAPNSCSACKKVHYCDQKCQKQDWNNHRVHCKQVKRNEQQKLDLLRFINQGGWFLEENLLKLVSKHSQAFLKFSSTDTTNDFDINNPPSRGNYGLSRIGYIHTHAIPNTKLGVDARFKKLGEKLLDGTYEKPTLPAEEEKVLTPAILRYEDELIWAWAFKKALILAQKKQKPFSNDNRILGLPLAEKQVMFGRDDHLALHAIATLFGNNQVIADYEAVLPVNIFAQSGQTGFTELHSMARAGRIGSVRFMIEGGMKVGHRDSSMRSPLDYSEESLNSSDALYNQQWNTELRETSNFLTLCAYLDA